MVRVCLGKGLRNAGQLLYHSSSLRELLDYLGRAGSNAYLERVKILVNKVNDELARQGVPLRIRIRGAVSWSSCDYTLALVRMQRNTQGLEKA